MCGCRSPSARSYALSNPFQTIVFYLSLITFEKEVGLRDDRIQYRLMYYRACEERALVTGLVCPQNEGCSRFLKTSTLHTPYVKPLSTHIQTRDESNS